MAKQALIVWGGWEGHDPEAVAAIFEDTLRSEGFGVEVSHTLDSLRDLKSLQRLSLIVPVWTMGRIEADQVGPLCAAVESGVGIAGCHGGMCDAFREATDYQWMTGGQWVAHPGNDGVEYTVRITDRDHFVTRGMPDFTVRSEQYYLHTDPSNRVLAVTRFPIADGPHVSNGAFDMPVIWTRFHGAGRVFYSSLGHNAAIVAMPEVREIMRRGFLWASRAVEA